LNRNATDPALVSSECDCNENKHHDQNDALFVFCEFENPKEPLHRSVAQLSLFNSGTPLSSLGFLEVVILSEAKNLSHFFLHARRANSQKCFAKPVLSEAEGLNMTRTTYLA
jgi:hypothetical protein